MMRIIELFAVFILLTGCTTGIQDKTDSSKLDDNIICQILATAYHENEWIVTERMTLYGNRMFRCQVYKWGTDKVTDDKSIEIPEELFKSLLTNIETDSKLKIADSIRTYSYGIDDNWIDRFHPGWVIDLMKISGISYGNFQYIGLMKVGISIDGKGFKGKYTFPDKRIIDKLKTLGKGMFIFGHEYKGRLYLLVPKKHSLEALNILKNMKDLEEGALVLYDEPSDQIRLVK